MAERHNNPLNVKLGRDTQYLVDTGVATVGEPATDGGNFLRFKSMSDGLDAANKLLTGPKYNSLTVDAALRRWSNNGYGGEIAEPLGIKPTTLIKDLSPNQITWLTGVMTEREMGTSAKSAPAKPSGVAEAATPSVPAQVADTLNLPANTEPASVTVDIEKASPDAPVTPQQVVAEIRRNYDLRGLNPAQVGDIVGHALEARKISTAAKAAQSQLIETEDGYLMVDKRTGELTPLTSGGKIDAKRLLDLNPATGKLSEFSKEMSTPDNRVRGKMTDSQSKAYEFGSRALQANERQARLESRLGSEQYATKRANVLSVLESLSPDIPMNVVAGVVGTLGAAPDVVKGELDALTAAGLGPAAARVMAALKERGNLTADERNFLQNQLEFAVAILRRESGAAIGVGEFLTTNRQYFPTIGDKEEDVLRKMRTRRQAIRGLRSSAGRPLLLPDVD
jgi:hypothetical protein